MPYLIEALVLGLVLSADSFSAAVAMGGRRFSTKDMFKFACASGGAEAIAALAGYFAGAKIIAAFSEYDHWVAFGLLGAVALHLAYEGVESLLKPQDVANDESFHSFTKILIVSFATSLDAFGVGIGLGLAEKPLVLFISSIAIWAFVATVVGLQIGNRFSKKLGPIFTLIAAAVLGYLATQMLSI